MHSKDADGIANSVDPDQTAPLSGSALFAQPYLSEKLGSLRYSKSSKLIAPDKNLRSLGKYAPFFW